MNQKIKYGIIGTGLMGREHISNINLIEEAEIIAISDTSENSLNETKRLLNKYLLDYLNLIYHQFITTRVKILMS